MAAARKLVAAAVAATLVAAASSTACTASLELDRFRVDDGGLSEGGGSTPINVSYFDVSYTAKSMQSHLNEYLEIRIVDRANLVQAKAVYLGVVGPDFNLYLGGVVPKSNAPYRLDVWADHNSSGKYDGIEGGINDKDHAWRRVLQDPLPEDMRFNGARYDWEFIHDTAFVDIFTDLQGGKITGEDTLLATDLTVVGAGGFVDKMVELRIVDKASGRLVGLFRQGKARDTFKAQITGIIDEETTYEVSAYVDQNGNGKYDADDPSWKVDLTSTNPGLVGTLDFAQLPRTPIVTGQP